MAGGTFTISNGGVYGSLLSTPIINPPQSAILGMHSIQQRPMVVDGVITPRPMMYVALSYDHRLIDGREVCCLPDSRVPVLEACCFRQDISSPPMGSGVAAGCHIPASRQRCDRRSTQTTVGRVSSILIDEVHHL